MIADYLKQEKDFGIIKANRCGPAITFSIGFPTMEDTIMGTSHRAVSLTYS